MTDHYQALGVSPAATDREIKKAYFALVRQFPPETHAEDFRRIREAYEVLSSTQARGEYDRARAAGGTVEPFSELGPELGAQMRAAVSAMNAERPKEAVPILQAVLAANPDVTAARDLLGLALMASGDLPDATRQFEELIRRAPENPLFHVRLGHCYRDRQLSTRALAAYLRARELAPEELGIRFVLSDFHASEKRWKEALEELDQAARLAEKRPERDFEPAILRVSVQLRRERSRLVKKELDSLLSSLPSDEEVRKHVSDRLSSLAARAFALQRPRDGNHLLEVARSLKPQRPLGSFPIRVTVDLDRLPEASQAWLKDQPRREVIKPLWSRGYDGALGWLALGLGLAGVGALVLLASLEAREPWEATQWALAAATVATGAWTTAAGIRRLVRAARSALGKFTTLHSHYLVQANLDRVTLWPLINLVKVSTTHQHSYGLYLSSAVRMQFGGMGGRAVSLIIRGKEQAEELANAAAGLRGRVLDLLSSGLLEADGELDFVPRALLSGKDPEARRRALLRARWPAAAALAGVVGTLAFVPLQARWMDDAAWEEARSRGPPAVSQYLDLRPDGRHAAEAHVEMGRALERALQRLRRTRPGQAPVLEELLEALRRAGTGRVAVRYSPEVKLGGFRVPAGVRMADARLPAAEQLRRHQRITAELQRRIDRLLREDKVVELRDGLGSATASSPVELHVHSELGFSGAVYSFSSDPAHKYYGLEVRSSVDLLGRHHQLRAEPDRELSWSSGPAPRAPVVYARMADAAMDALGKQIAEAVQLPE